MTAACPRRRLAFVAVLAQTCGCRAYRLRDDPSNPLKQVLAPVDFGVVSDAVYALNASAVLWLARIAQRGDSRAHVLSAALLRFCSILLHEETRATMCTLLNSSSCSCDALADAHLQAAHRAGDREATQAIIARDWRRGELRRVNGSLLRLRAAANAMHDGVNAKVDSPAAEMPAAVMPTRTESGMECIDAAEMLQLAATVDSEVPHAKAAVVAVSLRRLETRWRGQDPKDETMQEHLGAAEVSPCLRRTQRLGAELSLGLLLMSRGRSLSAGGPFVGSAHTGVLCAHR